MQNLDRYQRQYLFKPLGEEGQKKICASRVLVVGCGALGTVIVSTLARAGVGFLRIVDRDFIELNNLHRQVLFDEADVKANLPKAVAAANKVKAINSGIVVESIVSDVNFTNIENFAKDIDLVMDGTDNFETRFLINEACVKLGKPWIYGACVGSHGLMAVVIPKETPCLRCIFESAPPPELSPTCDTAGIIAPTATVIASLESTEAIKLLSGNKSAIQKSLFSFDVWTGETRSFRLEGLRELTNCPVCKRGEYSVLSGKESSRTSVLCGRNSVQIFRQDQKHVNFKELAARLEKIGKVSFNTFLLRAEIEKYEIALFPDGRAIIKGTSDPAQAKTVYSKYIGV
ncbi:MAG: ThiF family adenylyltransferase [Candidatus Omnitrophica bacterium]|nr:ThiF family adenylyltransferase [Candidatus Omnitrophota bacterium]